MYKKIALLVVTAFMSVGCASKLEADQTGSASLQEGDVSESGKFKSVGLADSVTQSIVDATVDPEWQRFDFDTAQAVTEEQGWDLAFCRFRVISNGGVSGDGGVEVAVLEGQAFADLIAAPSDGFQTDREDGDDGNMDPDNSFNSSERSWYDYNLDNHELTPGDMTYVIHSSAERYYKFHFENYYDDDNGTPAMLKFIWAEIDAP